MSGYNARKRKRRQPWANRDRVAAAKQAAFFARMEERYQRVQRIRAEMRAGGMPERLIDDNAEGAAVVEEVVAESLARPMTLFGFPVVESADMPNTPPLKLMSVHITR